MRTYKTLFEIDILHDYYKKGYGKDLIIIPTKECSDYIRNNKLVYRTTVKGFKVSYISVDDIGTPLINLSDKKFMFNFRLKDPSEFLSITDLDIGGNKLANGNIIQFKNDPLNVQSILPSVIHLLKPNEFTYTFPYKAVDPENDLATLEVLDFDNVNNQVLIFSDIEPDNLGYYTQKLKLPVRNGKKYILRISDTNNSSEDFVLYVDNELNKKNVFGLIEINYSSSALVNYQLQFNRKAAYWKYIIVNKNALIDFSSEQLELIDSTVDTVNPYDVYNFSNQLQPDDEININGYETAVFISETLIPYYEVPKLNIQLKKVSNPPHPTEIKLYSHLPNPKISGIVNNDNEAEIYVFI
ncbi:MAG: hypothetical protein GQ564_21695 [Bacteroidales bacterium]|nr:hypothetical protein [Bacteroidales bacterium]